MGIVNYDLVYRDGALVGAPVAKFRLADTYAELPSSVEGDLGYAKDTDRLYTYNGSIWVPSGLKSNEGIWQNAPFDSNRFFTWQGTGTWSIIGIEFETYTTINKTCLYSTRIYNSVLSGTSALAIRFPGGIIASHRASGSGKAYSPSLAGWVPITPLIEAGWDIVQIFAFANSHFPASDGFFIDIQIQFGIQ